MIKLKSTGVISKCAMCGCPFMKTSKDKLYLACAKCGTVYRKSDSIQAGYIAGTESRKYVKKEA